MGGRRICACLLIAAGLLPVLPALAQTTRAADRDQREGHWRHGDPRERFNREDNAVDENQPHGDWNRPPGPRWRHELLDPRPEDFGPLQTGEEDELRQCVNDNFPRLAQVLRRIETADPAMFQHAMKRLVPKLRQLRRIHAENGELANLIERYVVNSFALRKLRWIVMQPGNTNPEELERSARETIAENVELEIQALQLWADNMERARETRIDERVQQLLSDSSGDEMPLLDEPPDLRELVAEVKSMAPGAERTQKGTELRGKVGSDFDRRLAALRNHIKKMRECAPQTVDERVEHMLMPPPREERHTRP